MLYSDKYIAENYQDFLDKKIKYRTWSKKDYFILRSIKEDEYGTSYLAGDCFWQGKMEKETFAVEEDEENWLFYKENNIHLPDFL